MMQLTDNVNIRNIKPLVKPSEIRREYPLPEALAEKVVLSGRSAIQKIIACQEKRPLLILGPCSIHDRQAALEYAEKLRSLADSIQHKVLLVMRAYFEKPRTTIGWKGMLYDPHMDQSDDIQEGIRLSRSTLLGITKIGLPTATEVLDPIVPQYLADMIAWASIGARTAASQIHRQMASGLSMPIGFKNSTDGNPTNAIEAIKAAASPHAFLGITEEGEAGIASTRGNRYTHLVLRGGRTGPNYQSEHIAFAREILKKEGIENGIVVDCSHANSSKDFRKQRDVFANVLGQMREGDLTIRGMMLESFLKEGQQSVNLPPEQLQYGMSITDACIGWEETEDLVKQMVRDLQL